MRDHINSFGKYLRDTREGYEYSLRKFADEVNVDPAYLSRIEKGKIRKPGREVIEKIASAFCREINRKSQLILSSSYDPEAECEECPKGQYTTSPLPGASSCSNCGLGKYQPSTGSISELQCIPCSPGRYGNTFGLPACFECPIGTSAPSSGYSLCANCAVGTYTNSNSSKIWLI